VVFGNDTQIYKKLMRPLERSNAFIISRPTYPVDGSRVTTTVHLHRHIRHTPATDRSHVTHVSVQPVRKGPSPSA